MQIGEAYVGMVFTPELTFFAETISTECHGWCGYSVVSVLVRRRRKKLLIVTNSDKPTSGLGVKPAHWIRLTRLCVYSQIVDVRDDRGRITRLLAKG